MKKYFSPKPDQSDSAGSRSDRRSDSRDDKRPAARRESGRGGESGERKAYGSSADKRNTERKPYNAEKPHFGRRNDDPERGIGNRTGEGRRERPDNTEDRKRGDSAGRRPFNERRESAFNGRSRGDAPARRSDSDARRNDSGDRVRSSRFSEERPARSNDREFRGRDDRRESPGRERPGRERPERREQADRDAPRTERRAYPARENNRERREPIRSRNEYPRDGESRGRREEGGRPERTPYADNRRPSDSRRSGDGSRERNTRSTSPAYHEGRFGKKEDRQEGSREKRSERGRSDNAPERRSDRSEKPRETPTYDFKRLKTDRRAPGRKPKEEREEKSADKSVRLNRYIANAGVCSRRDADTLIESGEIKVNGKVITEMGYKVQPGDLVKYGNRVLNREKLVYVLLNKPKDFITTTNDPNERKTVMDLVKDACDQRIYPVGRLDRNTTGLLLLTNDGELADKLAHPSNEIKKVYQVELDKPLTVEDFDQIKSGLTLEDGPVKVDDLAIVTPDGMVAGIEIHSGRNRIVRRIFEHLGYEVLKLDRTVYAGLDKKDLPRGNWRFLSEKEVVKLKFFS